MGRNDEWTQWCTTASAAYPPGLEREGGSPVRQVQEEEEEGEEFARGEDAAKEKEGNVNTPSIDHANHLYSSWMEGMESVCVHLDSIVVALSSI